MDGVSARAKRRWLARWWIGQGAALYLLPGWLPWLAGEKNSGPLDFAGPLLNGEYALWMTGIVAAISTLQWVYLRPVRPPVAGKRPVRLLWSMLLGGFVIAALMGSAALALGGFLHDYGRMGAVGDAAGWTLLGIVAMNWILATPLLLAFRDRTASHEDVLARVATRLFAGTTIEVLAALPLDMLARRREDCWCARGTFLAVVVGTALGAILLGPVVFLLLLARRRRRWPLGRCTACGADVGEDLRVPRCPSCGVGWAE